MEKENRFMELQGGALIFVTRFTKDRKKVLGYNIDSNSLKFNTYPRKNIAKDHVPVQKGIDTFRNKEYDKTASDRKGELTILLKKYL